MLTTLYKTARAMATWTGITKADAWPLINELKNNLRVYDSELEGGRSSKRRNHGEYAFYYQETEPGVRATNDFHRAYMANNLCSFLQSNGINAVIARQEEVIYFVDYKSNSKDSKTELLGLLDALDPAAATQEEIKANEEILKTVKPGSW